MAQDFADRQKVGSGNAAPQKRWYSRLLEGLTRWSDGRKERNENNRLKDTAYYCRPEEGVAAVDRLAERGRFGDIEDVAGMALHEKTARHATSVLYKYGRRNELAHLVVHGHGMRNCHFVPELAEKLLDKLREAA